MIITTKQATRLRKLIKSVAKEGSIVHINKQAIVVESTLPFTNTFFFYLSSDTDLISDFITISYEVFSNILKIGQKDISIVFDKDKNELEVACGTRNISVVDYEIGEKSYIVDIANARGINMIDGNITSIIQTHKRNFPGMEVLANFNGLFLIDGRAYSTNQVSLLTTDVAVSCSVFLPSRICDFLQESDDVRLEANRDTNMAIVIGNDYKLVMSIDLITVIDSTKEKFDAVVNKLYTPSNSAVISISDLEEAIDVPTIKSYGPDQVHFCISKSGTTIRFTSKDNVAFKASLASLTGDPVVIKYRTEELIKVLEAVRDYSEIEFVYNDDSIAGVIFDKSIFITSLEE